MIFVKNRCNKTRALRGTGSLEGVYTVKERKGHSGPGARHGMAWHGRAGVGKRRIGGCGEHCWPSKGSATHCAPKTRRHAIACPRAWVQPVDRLRGCHSDAGFLFSIVSPELVSPELRHSFWSNKDRYVRQFWRRYLWNSEPTRSTRRDD
jgi:hypothetical protein